MNKLLFSLVMLLFTASLTGQNAHFTGLWDTGANGTIIEISGSENDLVGIIKSSEHPKAKAGTILIKNFKNSSEYYQAELYSMKRKEWYEGELKLNDGVLEIEIGIGLFKKTVSWRRILKNEL